VKEEVSCEYSPKISKATLYAAAAAVTGEDKGDGTLLASIICPFAVLFRISAETLSGEGFIACDLKSSHIAAAARAESIAATQKVLEASFGNAFFLGLISLICMLQSFLPKAASLVTCTNICFTNVTIYSSMH
jgi:hypothetical protein